MTAADMLEELGIFTNELSTGAGEADESRALKALDTAQTLFEAVVRTSGQVLSRAGDAEIATVANQGWSAFPSTLLRVDEVWLTNDAGEDVCEITQQFSGRSRSPLGVLAGSLTPGAPRQFRADIARFTWNPAPDGVYAIRVYGAWRGNNLVDRDVVFSFPDECSIPISTVAARMLRLGVDDPQEDITAFSESIYRPVMKGLKRLARTRPTPRHYRDVHTT